MPVQVWEGANANRPKHPLPTPSFSGHVKTTGSGWETLLRPAGDPEVPQTVETWCHRCKEDTKTVDRSSIYVDKDPRWTIGNHPMYVERKPTCKICADQGRVARFVPVDGKILSIFQTTLIETWREWDNKNLDRGMYVYLQLMEQVAPSGRTARFAKSRQEAGDPKKALVKTQ
ncbi:hypothetical protein EPUS_04663 [Endocarpon pusillum Z07020]|uniref:Uncharacterized protein n=1 Tax=Endocarpon pusillum (strain Z07020 / HMAS-L-300199) TaxID=1263415 RepID=U1HES3_ENDPU|nr:uncharacterized protein EPUS_04663 [Endocarpon pusillum Z07020]ERF68565.1 hypothetical protein EPUS_04663 [Endocarpon pusillum Z07020]